MTLPPLPTPLTALYKQVNGSDITADIYLPEPKPSNRHEYPVLLNIHGGAFMLGHSRMVSQPQIAAGLARNWIVVVPNHRLCPQVNILEGPVQDCRDCLAWVVNGGLEEFVAGELQKQNQNPPGDAGASVYAIDKEKIMAFGTSSGGMIALSLGYDTPHPPAAILNFYGAVHFTHPFWTSPLPHVTSKLSLPATGFDPSFLQKIYAETPVPTSSDISLEGQQSRKGKGPDFSRPRDAFAFTQIAGGRVLSACYPEPLDVREIDPVVRIKEVEGKFPPTCIVHGEADTMVPIFLSEELYRVLRGEGVRCEMVRVPGEDHTFANGMEVGGRTWVVSGRGFEFLSEVIGES